jgi:type II secretory pathway pseudopilin PulG
MYRAKKRFTLIELLVVAGLMVLMVSLALPAFSKMTGNNKVDVMTSNIKTALEQAQSTAVSRNVPVAVIFPLDKCNSDIASFAYGGYRLAEVEITTREVEKENGTKEPVTGWFFKRWISDSYLNTPDGAALVASVKSDDSKDKSGDDDGKPAKAEEKIEEFIEVKDVEDGISGNCAVIFKATGESVNNSMYLVVATADVTAESGGGAKLNKVSADDFRLLRTNQFTGRVDYVD